MQLDHLAQAAISQIVGRLVRRLLIALVLLGCAIVALYHWTIAGTMALESQFGLLYARLIVGGIYAAVAAAGAAALWLQSRSPRLNGQKALTSAREMQLVMLIEAVFLGYELARKGIRSR